MAVREKGKGVTSERNITGKQGKEETNDERKSALYFTKILLFVDT